jgi:flagellar basal-body rod protein FlgB
MLEGLGGTLEHYMDLLSTRQKLVASNLANADTPGYKAKDIDFKREFESQTGMEPSTVEVPGLAAKNDGNNVDVDREARMLSENAMRFNIASTLVRGQISQIRSAIQDGKSS